MQRLVDAGRGAAGRAFGQCLLAAALLLSAAAICPALAGEHANKNIKDVKAGFLVLAPDRGFAGNEEIGDAFDAFAKGRNASLVFITDERSSKYVKSGFDKLVDRGARRIAVVPLFMWSADPRYRLARRLLEQQKSPVPVAYAPLYGETFFAVEDLADRFRLVGEPSNSRLIIAGYGATDNDNEQAMRADLRRIAESAGAGFGFASIEVVIAYDVNGEEGEKRAAGFRRQLVDATAKSGDAPALAPTPVVVPFISAPGSIA